MLVASEEILINCAFAENRVAILENGIVQEIFIEREQHCSRVGAIFKGKVLRVLPGMQAAFVDIGLERAAFIHAGDISNCLLGEESSELDQSNAVPDIRSLLTEGQTIVVQVVKDQMGTKGARLTTNLSIPSRYLVLMPCINHIGVSQKIECEQERERLKTLVQNAMFAIQKEHTGVSPLRGAIVRTVAEGVSAEALEGDLNFLLKRWVSIKNKMNVVEPGYVIYADLPLFLRVIRDMAKFEIERVRIDDYEVYENVKNFVKDFMPKVTDKIEYYSESCPIFDLYSIEEEVNKALHREVQLKSGGYLVIDQTEAMTTVDINTGAFVGSKSLEETIFKTNLEASAVIARQLRLRNLGGIIIIDFIDMQDAEHIHQVLCHFEKYLEKDHAKTKITNMSEFGLVEMTRKRTRESLEKILCHPCPMCDGRSFIKTCESICFEIYREILRVSTQYNAQGYLVIASEDVIGQLLDKESSNVADLAKCIGKTINFQAEMLYHPEHYDVVLM